MNRKYSPIRYKIDISWSDEDKCYLARVPELPGCATDGASIEEAAANAHEAIEAYVESLDAKGLPLPPALGAKRFSGKIPLRIDPALHRNLAIRASCEGESLNQFLEKRLKKLA